MLSPATERTSALQIRSRDILKNPREPHQSEKEMGKPKHKRGDARRMLTFRALGGGATVGALRHGPLAAHVHGEVGRLAKGVDGGGGA
jgi:hypothetical protein